MKGLSHGQGSKAFAGLLAFIIALLVAAIALPYTLVRDHPVLAVRCAAMGTPVWLVACGWVTERVWPRLSTLQRQRIAAPAILGLLLLVCSFCNVFGRVLSQQ